MSQADSIPTTNPSGVTLTRKGEAYVDAHSHKNQDGPRPVLRSRRKPLRITKARRVHIEAVVDQLLDLLDAIDDDADAEPLLASPESVRCPGGPPGNYYGWGGWPAHSRTSAGDQTKWAAANRDDREEEHDGREPDDDGCGDMLGMMEQTQGEPSLGWLTYVNQVGRDWHGEAPWNVRFAGAVVDGEADDGEFEPSLGWTEMEARFGRYSDQPVNDAEEEHDGREPCCEDEGAQCEDEGDVEYGIADGDAVSDPTLSWSTTFNGEGQPIARKLLKAHGLTSR
jgi:hypothetical protein